MNLMDYCFLESARTGIGKLGLSGKLPFGVDSKIDEFISNSQNERTSSMEMFAFDVGVNVGEKWVMYLDMPLYDPRWPGILPYEKSLTNWMGKKFPFDDIRLVPSRRKIVYNKFGERINVFPVSAIRSDRRELWRGAWMDDRQAIVMRRVK